MIYKVYSNSTPDSNRVSYLSLSQTQNPGQFGFSTDRDVSGLQELFF